MKHPVVLDAKGERADKFIEANKKILDENDEVIIKNIDETVGREESATDYLVRKPNNIKSATNNNGNFSLTDDSIQAYIDKDGSYNASINITQNSSGRLGKEDLADEASYRKAKATLRKSDATQTEIEQAEKTLKDIYVRKKNEMQQILNKFAEFSDSEFTIEEAGGSWLGGKEYSFKISIRSKTQEDYNKVLQALSYVAEGLKQDAFIENLGEVNESEVTNEGLLNGEYTPTIHAAFTRAPTAREKALIQQDFTNNSTEDLPLDATITDNEIVFSFPTWMIDENLSNEEKIKAYNTLLDNWQNKINNILKEEKNDRFKDTYTGDFDIRFERSRFHSANSTKGEERDYSGFRNNNFPTTQQQGISEEKGREIRDFSNRVASSRRDSEIQTFTTPQGEVYGFVDKEGNIYLDETKISPEHPIHEYTHVWDRVVAERNPELWKRGVELMKQTSLWKEISESESYGKLWRKKGITGERLDNLIASEEGKPVSVVFSRTGRGYSRICQCLKVLPNSVSLRNTDSSSLMINHNNLRARAEAFLADISAKALAYLFPGMEKPSSQDSAPHNEVTFKLAKDYKGMEKPSSQDSAPQDDLKEAHIRYRKLASLIYGSLSGVPTEEKYSCTHSEANEDIDFYLPSPQRQLPDWSVESMDVISPSCSPQPENSSEPELDWKTIAILKEIEYLQRKYGITIEELTAFLNYTVRLSRLHIYSSGGIFLDDFDFKEVKMDTLTKSVYFLFLNHPEGINFKDMGDHQRELENIYSSLSRRDDMDGIRRSVATLCNPLDNSINEKVSKVKKAFRDAVDDRIARFYYIDGKKGEAKTIVLDRSLVIRD